MRAADPDHRPRGRALCHHCEATPGGCNGLRFIAGRSCCDKCDHTEETTR